MQDLLVLVVDDMRSMRAMVKGILQSMGLEKVLEAGDGQEAMAILCANKVDLVICDVEMPKMSGIELLDEVSKNEGLKHVPFIMLTAMSRREEVVEILKHGVFDFVLKPINPKILEDRVVAFLKSREQLNIPDLDF